MTGITKKKNFTIYFYSLKYIISIVKIDKVFSRSIKAPCPLCASIQTLLTDQLESSYAQGNFRVSYNFVTKQQHFKALKKGIIKHYLVKFLSTPTF